MRENIEKDIDQEYTETIDLQEVITIIVNKKWLIMLVFLICFGGSIFYVKNTPYIYESKVLIMKETTTEKLPADIIGIKVEPEKIDKGHEMILKSASTLSEMQKNLIQKYGFDVSVEQLNKWLSLSTPKDSANVIQIVAKGNSPEQAQAIANIASELYVSNQSEMKRTELRQGLSFLKQQIDQMESKIQETEKALSSFKDKEGLVISASDTESGGLLGKLSGMQNDLIQAENEVELANTQLQTIEKLIEEKRKYAKSATTSGVSAQIDQIREKLVSLKLELSAKMETRTDKDPEVISIRKKIESAEEQLKTEFDRLLSGTDTGSLDPVSELQNLMQQYITLTVQLKSAEKRAELMKGRLNQFRLQHPELPEKQVELMKLERQSRIYEQSFATLTNKYEDMRLMEQMRVAGLKIVDPASLPKSPKSPNVLLTIVLGAFLGLFLGIGLAFFLHYIDDTINTEEDVTKFVNLPVLGTIPKITPYDVPETALTRQSNAVSVVRNNGLRSKSIKEMRNLLGHSILYAPKSSYKTSAKEGYFNLAVNIQFASVDKKVKSLLITSSSVGEGKTTTASNLAITMARPDMSVLLIDADIRRPKLHRILGQNRQPGLLDILASDIGNGRDLLDGFIRQTQVNNLYLLPAGSHIPNIGSLFASQKMSDLIERLKQKYDMIVIDSSPILSAADSIALSSKVDGVLLVLFSGKTDGKTANRGIKALERINANIIGTVVTDVDYAKHYGYYRYYRYYYHYYHHYGADEGKDNE